MSTCSSPAPCLSLAVMHEGHSITTIEGLGTPGNLHPLQAAVIKRDAYQRGYCTAAFEQGDLARLHSPAGLDLGANGPAEIALSIVAEMRAALDGRRGGMLHERRGPIHVARTSHRVEAEHNEARSVALAS